MTAFNWALFAQEFATFLEIFQTTHGVFPYELGEECEKLSKYISGMKWTTKLDEEHALRLEAMQAVNPWELPQTTVTNRDTLPEYAAVYFVLHAQRVLYIGKTGDLRFRWKNHHLVEKIPEPDSTLIAWQQFPCGVVPDEEDPERIVLVGDAEFEERSIRRWDPPFNNRYTPRSRQPAYHWGRKA